MAALIRSVRLSWARPPTAARRASRAAIGYNRRRLRSHALRRHRLPRHLERPRLLLRPATSSARTPTTSGTARPTSPATTASSCPAASPTATTCAPAPSPASHRSWTPWRATRRRQARHRHLQRLPDTLRGRPAARRPHAATTTCSSAASSVDLRVETTTPPSPLPATKGQVLEIPISHDEGSYYADDDTLPAWSRRPRRLPLLHSVGRHDARGQPQRLAEQHRRHHQREQATSWA